MLAWLASAAIRWWQFDDRGTMANIDASYHVLLTVRALNETSASAHHFLPIVTLGRPLDRDIPFGASVHSPAGIYYYTSFAPLGFIAPWAFFKATTLAPTLRTLMVFNLVLHLGATLLLAMLALEIVGAAGIAEYAQRLIVALAALSYLFNLEALWSHGPVYWHHSLFQVVWIGQLLAAVRVLRAIDSVAEWRRADSAALVITSVVGPSIEWTGYLATAATAGVIWWQSGSAHRRRATGLAFAMLVGAGVAGLVFIAQFSSAVGLRPLLAALGERADTRSTAHGSMSALAAGYVQSFGALLLLVAGTLIAYAVLVRRRPPRWIVGVLILVLFPLVENLLLAEHATLYTFDRLKALVTCVAIVASIAALLPQIARDRMLLAWAAVVAWMLTQPLRPRVGDSIPPLSSNQRLLQQVRDTARPCAVYGTNGFPRGWTMLSVGANVYQTIPNVDSLRHIADARGACQAVYLKMALDAGESMYVWESASVYDAQTGRVDVIPGTMRRRPRISSPDTLR